MSSPHKFETAREKFARNLLRWRTKRGMTQEALAADAGLSRVYISRIENCSDTVSLDNMEKLAAALKIEIVDFLMP